MLGGSRLTRCMSIVYVVLSITENSGFDLVSLLLGLTSKVDRQKARIPYNYNAVMHISLSNYFKERCNIVCYLKTRIGILQYKIIFPRVTKKTLPGRTSYGINLLTIQSLFGLHYLR